MADAGVAEQPPVPEGAAAYNKLIAGGFSAQDADQWKAEQTGKLLQGGFTPKEITSYWGEGEAKSQALDTHMQGNLGQITDPEHAQQVADTPMEQLAAGWNMSVAGLALNGAKPDKVLPEKAGVFAKILSGAGQFAGDLPATVAGFFGGALLGTAAGAAGGAMVPGANLTGVPEAVGGVVGGLAGGGAGAAALPQALREIMLDSYGRGEIHTFDDFMAMAGRSLVNTGKAALAGAVAGPLGAGAGKVAAPVLGSVLASGANATTQALTYTAVGGALDGKVPDADDFVTGAFMALGFHAAGSIVGGKVASISEAGKRVQSNLQDIYKSTGLTPWQAVSQARNDPKLRDEILGQDVNGDPVTPGLKKIAPTEPEPYKPAPPLHVPSEADINVLSDDTKTPDEKLAGASAAADAAAAEREKQAAQKPAAAEGEADIGGGATLGEHMLPLVRGLEKSADDAISPKGAIGRYQIMPGTARQYGFDPLKLKDPVYNETVARTVLNDLWRRFNGNASDVLVAYNAGPGFAQKWIAGGRKVEALPKETQRYLDHAGQIARGGGLPAIRTQIAQADGGGAGGAPPRSPGGGGADDITPPNPAIGGPEQIRYTTDMLHDKVRDMIGEEAKPDSLLDPKNNYRQWISELGPARDIDKLLVDQGFDKHTQLGLEDMFRQSYASDWRVGAFVKKSGVTFDRAGNLALSDAPSLMDAVKAVKEDGGNLSDFVTYMLTKRAQDKEAQGFDTGHPLTPEQRAQLLSDDAPKYARAMASWNKTMDSVLEYGRDSGVFSPDQVAAMQRDNPAYISFRRIMGEQSTRPKRGKNFKVFEPTRRFEGDDRQIQDPMMASIDNIHQIVRMADRNRAVGSIITLAERNGLMEDLGLTKLEPPKIDIAEPGSGDFKPYYVNDTEPYKPFLAVKAQRKGFDKNQFLYIRNGVPEMWAAKDEALASLIRGADSPGEANIVGKLFQSVAQLQRAGIVTTPDFPARITLRHQTTAYVLDRQNPPPFVTWMRGAMHAFGQDETYWKWVTNGGAGTALADMDANALHRDMNAIFEKTGTWDKMWNVVRHPIEAAQILSEKIDASARIGYMKQAEASGIEPLKAATMGRKAMLDYSEKGTLQFAQWWARSVPFMRPHFLGLKQFGEAITENPGPTLAKAFAAITLPSVMLYGLNYLQDQYGGLPEDQKYENLPRYYKDGMYIFPQVGGVRLRLPLPFVVGVPFGGFTNRFLDHFVKHDPRAFTDWFQTLAAEFIPPFVPSLVLPAVEHVTNYNFFTGKALIPASMEKASGAMQYTENTTEPAKALARVVQPLGADISPIAIENYARQWAGTLGMDALHAMNAPFNVSGKPWEMSDIPFVQSWLIRNPGSNAQPIQDFYTEKGEFEKTRADVALAKKRVALGSASGPDELQTSLEAQMPLAGVDNISKAISLQQSVLQAVNHSNEMSTDEKRQFADTIYSNMITMAKGGLSIMRQIKAGMQQ